METNRDLKRYRRLLRQAVCDMLFVFDEGDLAALIRVASKRSFDFPEDLLPWLERVVRANDSEDAARIASLMRDVRALTSFQLAALLDMAERHAATGALEPDLDALLA